jgi:hypothetical protein
MYHYTYRLTLSNNTDSRKYYIGARSCTEYPTEDSYFGSCKTLLAWIKEHGTKGIVKEILAIYGKRQDAIEHEINLHNYFDVAKNVEFWNKAKQTSVGFDTTGIHISKSKEHRLKIGLGNIGRIVSEETKQKIREKAIGRKHSQEQNEKHRLFMIGHKHSQETKQKISLSNKGKKCSDKQKQTTSKIMQGMIICFDMEQKKSVKIPKEEYHSNKDRYKNNYSKEVRGLESK